MCTHTLDTYAYLHICSRLYAQTDGQIDIYGRSKGQKTEDGSVKINRKKHCIDFDPFDLCSFAPSFLCSKLGYHFMTLKVSVK